jgi:hypothetical protein
MGIWGKSTMLGRGNRGSSVGSGFKAAPGKRIDPGTYWPW